MTNPNDLTRRAAVAGAVALAPVAAIAAGRKIVTLLGDSITAGYGLSASAALPAQLQTQLNAMRVPAVIRGAGISGDTSAGGLARLDRSVKADTDICVVALGGNDMLQFIDPSRTRANLDGIIRRLKARRISVILVGIKAPPEFGGFAQAFDGIYASLAREHGVPLYADLLAGVARSRVLNQSDGVHPNAKGVAVIASRLAPVIKAAVSAA